MSDDDRQHAADALRRTYAAQLKASLHALKRDVAASIRLCSRDFGVLGQELVSALQQRQEREQQAHLALDHERKRRRKLQHQVSDLQGSIRVLCRVRPALRHDVLEPSAASAPSSHSDAHQTDATADTSPKQKLLRVHVESEQELRVCSAVDGTLYKSYAFARVFREESTQTDVFRDVAPLVLSAMDGRHACVFAYGQTGAGKTYTMEGADARDPGVYARALGLIFDTAHAQHALYDVHVTLQLVEIYNEEVYDLLAPSASASGAPPPAPTQQLFSPPTTGATSSSTYPPSTARTPVEIRHGDHGVYLKNVTTVAVTSADDAVQALERGAAQRSVSATAKHSSSSRAHCVLTLDIARTSRVSGAVATGRLVLVDLAGSERLAKTEETTGVRLREAQCINKSLCAISDVMSALLAKDKHIPFRNSKLTHLLQDSLGTSASQTLVLVHVSPDRVDVSETLDTLKFAARVAPIPVTSARRSDRVEVTRLHGIIASQATQLQTLQEKLATELELRKKYEKRLEEYRQEEHRRRAREDELKRQHALAPLSQSSILSPEQQQLATRRWSLYTRKDNMALKSAHNARGLNGVENISENILRSRAALVHGKDAAGAALEPGAETPLRQKRRLSPFAADKAIATTGGAPSASQLGKRSSASDVKSILKKRRVEVSAAKSAPSSLAQPKQVSFHLSPHTPSPTAETATRSAGQLLRTTSTASRVPTAARVRTTSFTSSPVRRVVAATPRHKPKTNVGWR